MARIGDVEFNVLSESRTHSSDVTNHPVEDGVDIVDHVQIKPRVYSIEGVVGDDHDPANAHLRLVRMQRRGDLVNYAGRAVINNCIIESLTVNVDSSAIRGFTFSMTIREVRIAKSSTVALLPVPLKVDMAEVGNVGRVQPQ